MNKITILCQMREVIIESIIKTAPPDLSEAVIEFDVKSILGGLHHTYARKRAS